jgi:hypothetical protein
MDKKYLVNYKMKSGKTRVEMMKHYLNHDLERAFGKLMAHFVSVPMNKA